MPTTTAMVIWKDRIWNKCNACFSVPERSRIDDVQDRKLKELQTDDPDTVCTKKMFLEIMNQMHFGDKPALYSYWWHVSRLRTHAFIDYDGDGVISKQEAMKEATVFDRKRLVIAIEKKSEKMVDRAPDGC